MDFTLTEEHRMVQQMVREFARREVARGTRDVAWHRQCTQAHPGGGREAERGVGSATARAQRDGIGALQSASAVEFQRAGIDHHRAAVGSIGAAQHEGASAGLGREFLGPLLVRRGEANFECIAGDFVDAQDRLVLEWTFGVHGIDRPGLLRRIDRVRAEDGVAAYLHGGCRRVP